jgi:hypothetical protein
VVHFKPMERKKKTRRDSRGGEVAMTQALHTFPLMRDFYHRMAQRSGSTIKGQMELVLEKTMNVPETVRDVMLGMVADDPDIRLLCLAKGLHWLQSELLSGDLDQRRQDLQRALEQVLNQLTREAKEGGSGPAFAKDFGKSVTSPTGKALHEPA